MLRRCIQKTVFAMVTLATALNNNRLSTWLPYLQVLSSDSSQALMERHLCNYVNATLLKTDNKPSKHLTTVLVASARDINKVFTIKLKVSDCPLGFELQSKRCVCSKFLDYIGIDHCEISSKTDNAISTIERPEMTWLGFVSKSKHNLYSVIGVAETCYLYCALKKSDTVFVVNSTSITTANSNKPSNSTSLCLNNREGPLCSQCSPGYSVVFGSNECKQCSNWWLLILIVYAVAGPLFICLLYALKLTLTTGTLNGIIFCAQLFEVIDLPQSKFDITSTIIKAFLLFEVDNPHCFYDGMTEIWKSGITLLYPVNTICFNFNQSFFCQNFKPNIWFINTSIGHCGALILHKVAIVNNRCIHTYQYIHKHK